MKQEVVPFFDGLSAGAKTPCWFPLQKPNIPCRFHEPKAHITKGNNQNCSGTITKKNGCMQGLKGSDSVKEVMARIETPIVSFDFANVTVYYVYHSLTQRQLWFQKEEFYLCHHQSVKLRTGDRNFVRDVFLLLAPCPPLTIMCSCWCLVDDVGLSFISSSIDDDSMIESVSSVRVTTAVYTLDYVIMT